MGRDPKERHIGEHTYRVRPLAPTRIFQTAPILAKLVLPALGKLVDSAAGSIKDVLDADLSNVGFGEAAHALMSAWDQPQMDKLLQELAASTEVQLEGSRWPQLSQVFDAHFMGRTGEMLGWLAFAMEEQYRDFFGGLLAGAGKVQALKGSQSPSTSAGQSGE